MFSLSAFKQLKNWKPGYRLSRRQQADAERATLMLMLDTVISLQVKTTYGLSYAGVAKLLGQQSGNMSRAAEAENISRRERAYYLYVSSILLQKVKELKFEGEKHAGDDES